MVPTGWLSVLLFLLLVAPGLAFELLSEKRRAAYVESTFREISRLVLGSTAFTALGLVFLAIARTIWPASMPDPGQLLLHRTAYVDAHYRLILRTILVEVAVAMLAVCLLHLYLGRKTPARIRRTSAWGEVFGREVPSGWEAHVRIRLDDGSVWMGAVAGFTADLNTEGREIVLAPPFYSRVSGNKIEPVPDVWRRVVIRGDDIKTLAVRYVRKVENAAG